MSPTPFFVIDPAHSGGPAAFATLEEAEEYAERWDGEIVPASQIDPDLRSSLPAPAPKQ